MPSLRDSIRALLLSPDLRPGLSCNAPSELELGGLRSSYLAREQFAHTVTRSAVHTQTYRESGSHAQLPGKRFSRTRKAVLHADEKQCSTQTRKARIALVLNCGAEVLRHPKTASKQNLRRL